MVRVEVVPFALIRKARGLGWLDGGCRLKFKLALSCEKFCKCEKFSSSKYSFRMDNLLLSLPDNLSFRTKLTNFLIIYLVSFEEFLHRKFPWVK